jgi:uncharacterized coiled-coil DUF342 family protein
VLSPNAKVKELQAQIKKLNKEKKQLWSSSLTEIQRRQEANNALNTRVQILLHELQELNKEANALMVF